MSDKTIYTADWHYDPNQHLMNLKGKAYLDVQNRLVWFIRDQRDFINRGLASCSYVIRTELVEMDRQAGFAQFKTYVRDVLGNEATMYGSETAKDFGDYAEKASTKSLGRTLAMLGYGTQFAPEMDEGERVVDTPVERRQQQPQPSGFVAKPPTLKPAQQQQQQQQSFDDEPATKEQQERMAKYREALGISDKSIVAADNHLRYNGAEARIADYIADWKQRQLRSNGNGKAEVTR